MMGVVGRALVVSVLSAGTFACSLLIDTSDLSEDGSSQGDARAEGAVAPGGGDDAANAPDAPGLADARDAPGPTADAGDATAGDGRVSAGLVALYKFAETSGTIVHDVSGVVPPLDLAIDTSGGGAASFVADGLAITANSLVASSGPATKIFSACQASSELTVEAWVTPANTTQSAKRIVGIGGGFGVLDFSFDQGGTNYDFILASPTGSLLHFNAASVTVSRTHIIGTRAQSAVRTIYVNGKVAMTDSPATSFTNWNTSFRVTLANSTAHDSDWVGSLHLFAVYARALAPSEVAQNYAAGPR
jgi:hypothetical protein